MAKWRDVLKMLVLHRQVLLFIFLPILTLPMILVPKDNDQADKIAEFGYCLINISCFWIFDVLPISATALLPYILFPSFGLMSSSAVAAKYMSNTNLLLVGSFMIAIAVEETGLHKRIALGALKLVGSNPRCLMFGFMVVTYILSMCIANTSTAALMVPIVLSVLEELHAGGKEQSEHAVIENKQVADYEIPTNRDDDQETSFHNSTPSNDSGGSKSQDLKVLVQREAVVEPPRRKLDIGLLLCIPFACSIGGTGTLTGTDLNLYLAGYYETNYKYFESNDTEWINTSKDGYRDLTYANWAMYNLLPSALIMLLSYVWMQSLYVGFNPKEWFRCFTERNEGAKRVIDESYRALGGVKRSEIITLICFVSVVVLWVTRDPSENVKGWKYLFPEPSWMTDGMSVVFIGMLLFMLPMDDSGLFSIFNCCKSEENKISMLSGPAKPILTWNVVQLKSSWGVLILIGGGYAIADASNSSGFSDWVAENLANLVQSWDPWTVCLLCSTMAALFTEITSNSASCALFVPLLDKLALEICVHPLYLTLPATIACSLSFMLPVATPPNAIAFGTGRLITTDTLVAGSVPKLIGISIVNMFIAWFGPIIYATDVYPCFAQYVSCCVDRSNLQLNCPHDINTCNEVPI